MLSAACCSRRCHRTTHSEHHHSTFLQGTGFNGGGSSDRGANTAEEFARQRAKIINAITTISPDVVGLTEVSALPVVAALVICMQVRRQAHNLPLTLLV